LAKGDTYKRQVNPAKRQMIFRNIDPDIASLLDDCCELRGVTRKQFFLTAIDAFIQSTMTGIKHVLGDQIGDQAWDKKNIQDMLNKADLKGKGCIKG
tara:strand:- start:1349 stop:1639 length:291 start_codon:yes stop_codon:yes gene_type:complete